MATVSVLVAVRDVPAAKLYPSSAVQVMVVPFATSPESPELQALPPTEIEQRVPVTVISVYPGVFEKSPPAVNVKDDVSPADDPPKE